MKDKMIVARKLNEHFKRKLLSLHTKTGIFSLMEFGVVSEILDNADRLKESQPIPIIKTDCSKKFRNSLK